jgi:hypothetical protein
MKPILILLTVFFAFCGSAGAQRRNTWGLYGGFQSAHTKYGGAKGSIDVHWHRKHSIGINITWMVRDANNLPEDYDIYRRHTFWDNGGTLPVSIYIWTLSYGRYLPLDRAGKLRMHLKMGLSAGSYKTPDNFRLVYHPASGGWFGSSAYSTYEYDYVTRELYGVTLNPSIEYAPVRGFGFTIGALA